MKQRLVKINGPINKSNIGDHLGNLVEKSNALKLKDLPMEAHFEFNDTVKNVIADDSNVLLAKKKVRDAQEKYESALKAMKPNLHGNDWPEKEFKQLMNADEERGMAELMAAYNFAMKTYSKSEAESLLAYWYDEITRID